MTINITLIQNTQLGLILLDGWTSKFKCDKNKQEFVSTFNLQHETRFFFCYLLEPSRRITIYTLHMAVLELELEFVFIWLFIICSNRFDQLRYLFFPHLFILSFKYIFNSIKMLSLLKYYIVPQRASCIIYLYISLLSLYFLSFLKSRTWVQPMFLTFFSIFVLVLFCTIMTQINFWFMHLITSILIFQAKLQYSF